MNEKDVVKLIVDSGLSESEEALLRATSQVARLTQQIERVGGKVLFGEFTLRDGSKSTVYVEWPDKWTEMLGNVAATKTAECIDLKQQVGELHAVIEYCLVHLEHATEYGSDEHNYIESHIAIRLRDVLNREVASTYVGGLERSREHWLEKAKEMKAILEDVFMEDDGILLSETLRQRISDLGYIKKKQEELPLEIPGKEANNPFQGGGSGGVPDGK